MAVPPSRAIAMAGQGLTHVLETHGPHAIALYLPESISPETQYIATKLTHGTLRSARLFGDIADAIASVERGDVHALWMFGGRSLDDSLVARRTLLAADLLIMQDSVECPIPADIFFPAIREDSPPASSAARPDWWWIQKVALAMGFRAGLQFDSSEQIRDEILRQS